MKITEKSKIELREIQEKLEVLSNKINKLQKEKFETKIIDNADFIQLMNISNSTARNWRNKGLIAYSQIENKIYYQVADIKKLIANNYYAV